MYKSFIYDSCTFMYAIVEKAVATLIHIQPVSVSQV